MGAPEPASSSTASSASAVVNSLDAAAAAAPAAATPPPLPTGHAERGQGCRAPSRSRRALGTPALEPSSPPWPTAEAATVTASADAASESSGLLSNSIGGDKGAADDGRRVDSHYAVGETASEDQDTPRGSEVGPHNTREQPVTADGLLSLAWTPRQQCSICLEDVTYGQKRGQAHPLSGCTHAFHWTCLLDALVYDSNCPNCRRPLHTYGLYELDGWDSDAAVQDGPIWHLPDEQTRLRQGQEATRSAAQARRAHAAQKYLPAWVLPVVLIVCLGGFVVVVVAL
jgi:hypothetical protein